MQPLRSSQFSVGSEFYEISDSYDQSLSGFSGDFEYDGYLNMSGKWIIQRHQISTGAYRYINGSTAYAANWALAIAGSLSSYDYYHKMLNTVP